MMLLFAKPADRRASARRECQAQCSLHWLVMLILHGALLAGFFTVNGSVTAQTRDHLTDPETDLVRFYQELDKRTEVFIKAIDRRFAIINGTSQPAAKKLVKDEPDWGELPKGTRAELLGDIAGILDEAITNLDDVSHRDEKNPLISRSLRKLTASANGYLRQLSALKEQVKDPDEAAAIDHAADNAKQIIEVVTKLPAAEPVEKKKKKP